MDRDTTETYFSGPIITDQGVRFRLWAPSAPAVSVRFPDQPSHPLRRREHGFFEALVPSAAAGQRYMFEIAGESVPDPASRAQELDAIGWSVVCPPLAATARHTPPCPWHEAIICEVHVGAVTPEGTFAALTRRLEHFAAAGYTAIELMPLAEFMGNRNWGYDGALLFAPDHSYGDREELRALIDRAHALGLGVLLDVVYNHFGPSGNFLHAYAEPFFSASEHTPWGAAIDLDNPLVRAFFVENARMWIGEFGFDGLRFDAVHAMSRAGRDRLLDEIADAVRAIAPDAWLVLENADNAADLLAEGRGLGRYSAQWNDDFHHFAHVIATGETDGYYEDYVDDPIGGLARVLTDGFFYQGQYSRHLGAPRGQASAHLPPTAFVAFAQNHDQIGNRAKGDRLTATLSPDKLDFVTALVMLMPQIPLFFMGEEYGATTPFLYFCDFEGELAEAIRKGRAAEFGGFSGFSEGHDGVRDPIDPATFAAAKLDWDAAASPEGARRTAMFRALAALRRTAICPLLASRYQGADADRSGGALRCRWRFDAGEYAMALNPADAPAEIAADPALPPLFRVGEVLLADNRAALGAWSLALWVRG